MAIDITSTVTHLRPSVSNCPSVKVTFNGYTLDLGPASDRLLDSFIQELTNCLCEMSERRQRHGSWDSYEYQRAQVHYQLRGLMQERSRRLVYEMEHPPQPHPRQGVA